MKLFDGIADPAFLMVNRNGLAVADGGLSLTAVGPFVETLHAALEAGETDYAVWSSGTKKYMGTAIKDCFLIVECGPTVPLTRLLYALPELRARCGRLL